MLFLYLIVFIWDCFLYIDVVFGTDYCKFSANHMLCGNGSFHSRCGGEGDYIYKEITKNNITKILHSHNKYRNQIALGRVTGGHGKPFPKAANMEEMKWDSELANIAEGMVKKCIFQHLCIGNSSCRRTDRHKEVGENIYSMFSTVSLKELHDQTDFEDAPHDWFFKEKDFYDPSDLPQLQHETNSLGKNIADNGHFTEMIWWNAMRLGCAKICFRTQESIYNSEIIITCLYAPAGNVVRSNIYEKGKPCTKCDGQGRTCSKRYTGLCAATGRPNDPDPPEDK